MHKSHTVLFPSVKLVLFSVLLIDISSVLGVCVCHAAVAEKVLGAG